MIDQKRVGDPLLHFLKELLESDQEKEIVSMMFMSYSETKIIEQLINYSEEQGKESGHAQI